jgi:hypothetical protein
MLLTAFVAAAAGLLPLGSAASPADIARVRIGVRRDGITSLTPADLQSLGINPASVDPRTFALTSLGAPVAILVTGETDGKFDSGDRILFFGEKFRGPEMDQKYTDERVYWLETGGTAGPRIGAVDVAPAGAGPVPSNVLTTVRAEYNNHWWTLHSLGFDTQDTWFWERIQTGPNPGDSLTRDLAFAAPDPAPDHAATLRVEQLSRYNANFANFYHRTALAVSGTPVGTFDWQGTRRIVHTAAVPAGLLSGNTATVNVTAINRTDKVTTSDDIYVNYWELDYRRLFRAYEGRFDFRAEAAGTREYIVNGWTSDAVTIWDVTAPAAPKALINAATSPAGAEHEVRFRVTEAAGQRYWLQTNSAFSVPASVRLRNETGFRAPAGGADVVIVTHASLKPATKFLANWHRSHGRRVVVADAQDVYDEFNQGIYHPKAIPAMLAWARDNWTQPGPSYLTLLGDGHWNFKSYNTAAYPAPPIMIPPYLAWVDPWQGEVPADSLFGDLTGDGVPEVAVGRLPAANLDEALLMVDKVVDYDESARTVDWQKRTLFVADNNDGNDFTGLSDDIIDNHLPVSIAPQRIYLGQTHADAASAKTAIRDAINAGAVMVQFVGHGATWRWTHEQIWTKDDVPTLANGGSLPIVLTFNCLDGYFAHTDPSQESIAEAMLRRTGGGSVAAISPSGLGAVSAQHRFREILSDILFKEEARELGRALQLAKQRYLATYGTNYLLYTQSLYGDPAMMIPGEESAKSIYLPMTTATH